MKPQNCQGEGQLLESNVLFVTRLWAGAQGPPPALSSSRLASQGNRVVQGGAAMGPAQRSFRTPCWKRKGGQPCTPGAQVVFKTSQVDLLRPGPIAAPGMQPGALVRNNCGEFGLAGAHTSRTCTLTRFQTNTDNHTARAPNFRHDCQYEHMPWSTARSCYLSRCVVDHHRGRYPSRRPRTSCPAPYNRYGHRRGIWPGW